MRKIVFIGMLALIGASCAKSKAKKNIEGTWYETKIGNTEIGVGAQDMLTFTKIKGGEGTMTITDAGGAIDPVEYEYWLEDKGEKLVFVSGSGGFGTVKSTRNILELSSSTMRIDWGSSAYIGTYSK